MRVRLVGATAAACVGGIVSLAALAAGSVGSRIGLAGLLIAVPLGWLLAPRAAQPGGRSVPIAAALFALIAVPVGDVLIAVLLSRADGVGGADATSAAGSLATFGLLIFGIPAFVAVLSLALIWGTIVQAVGTSRTPRG